MKIAELDDGETVELARKSRQWNIDAHEARMVRFQNGGIGANGKCACRGRKFQETASGC